MCSRVLIYLVICLLPAVSDIHRVALIVGNDNGLENEHPLKYASRDARMMADILINSGGFESERVYLQINQPMPHLKSVFKEIIARLKEFKIQNEKVLFFLYYSGHGSKSALHIEGEHLHKNTLQNYIQSLSAHLKIGVIDACESGNLLRQKGGKLIQHHQIEKVDEIKNKGTIMFSSSSKGELAQESEHYRGAVFTHHLINGLKGGADYNNDLSVSLWEAFHYANVCTKRENIHGKLGQQNPNFDFDIVGASDLVLTTLQPSNSRILFAQFPRRTIEIRDAESMTLEAKVHLSGRDTVYFQCPSKRYVISFEKGNQYFVHMLDMTWKNQSKISLKHFKRLSKAEVFSKGKGAIRLNPHALRCTFQSLVIGTGTKVPLIAASYCHRGFVFKHNVSIGFGRALQRGKWMDITRQVYHLNWSPQYAVLRYKRGRLLAGLQLGWFGVYQSLRDKRFSQKENPYENEISERLFHFSNVYETGLHAEHEVYIWNGIILSLSGRWGLQYYMLNGETKLSLSMRPQIATEYRF